ncbi:MAG: ribosomal protein S18-alanine N-acetyltransferase [candidate division WOR-3 bacterium]
MISIRRMEEGDLDQVLQIEHATFPNPWRRSFFLSDIHRPDGLCIVAENESRVVGYLIAWGRIEVHIANIAVAAEWRNQGVGTELMRRALQFAASQQAESVFLEVRVSNTGAQRFYRRFGFVPTYVRRGYYENGEDALIMELALLHE